MSIKEYLKAERKSNCRMEYYDGAMVTVKRSPNQHHKIVGSIIGELGKAISQGPWHIMANKMRVHNPLNQAFLYPDVIVTCEHGKYLDEEFDTLLNPTIIFEVLSKSTEAYDRGVKFKLYRSMPSLQHYVVVSSIEVAAEVYTRNGDNWILSTASTLQQSLYLSAIDYVMKLQDLYAQVPELK
jgi:Uma2 family endonuclease